jgi:hypothetical protein
MDPITRAMRQLGADAEAFWREHPGRLLPLIAAEDERQHVVQALRLRENAADNRRPFVVYEAPFVATATYFPQLAKQIAEDYELLRTGLAEEGVELPPFASDEGTVPSGTIKRAALAMDRAARLLGERFEGLVVALVPEHVADVAAWRDGISLLAATRWAPRSRIAVLAPPGGALAGVLGDEGARFQVDSDALLTFLKDFSPGASAGPPAVEDAQAGEAPAAPHAAGLGAKLRSLLLDAAAELSAGRAAEAVSLYREARAACQAQGLVEQEAAVLIALGGACLASGAPEVGAESYRHAAVIAEGAGAWPLACQAWLGMGGAYLPRAEYAPAAVAYRAAAEAAKRGEVVPLRIEALRMAGTCLLHLGREDDAMLAWKVAVDVGADVDAAERGASTFEEVGRALAKLLERRGLARQAEHVRALVERPVPKEREHEAR